MRVAVIYTAVTNGPITSDYLSRFVATWIGFPPGVECQLFVGCNGGPLSTEHSLMLATLNPRLIVRENDSSWDIGLYMDAARGACKDYDMQVCLGESVYFHREGWLRRLVEAWQRHGPGMYGPYASNTIRGHLNTTAFCCAPSMLASYPKRVKTKADRYFFEHGEGALWRHLHRMNAPVRMVTWDGEWGPNLWRLPLNILWRGDQSNCLMFCNHTDAFAAATPAVKQNWLRTCDQPFR